MFQALHGTGDTLEHKTDSTFCPHGACILAGETGSNSLPLSSSFIIYDFFPFCKSDAVERGDNEGHMLKIQKPGDGRTLGP